MLAFLFLVFLLVDLFSISLGIFLACSAIEAKCDKIIICVLS